MDIRFFILFMVIYHLRINNDFLTHLDNERAIVKY